MFCVFETLISFCSFSLVFLVAIQILVQVCMFEHVRASVLDGIECR